MLYELIVIFRPELGLSQVDTMVDEFAGIIKQMGGKVDSVHSLGLHDFAYRIKKHDRGYYVQMNLDCDSTVLDEVCRRLGNSEDILRHLRTKVERFIPAVLVKKEKV